MLWVKLLLLPLRNQARVLKSLKYMPLPSSLQSLCIPRLSLSLLTTLVADSSSNCQLPLISRDPMATHANSVLFTTSIGLVVNSTTTKRRSPQSVRLLVGTIQTNSFQCLDSEPSLAESSIIASSWAQLQRSPESRECLMLTEIPSRLDSQ